MVVRPTTLGDGVHVSEGLARNLWILAAGEGATIPRPARFALAACRRLALCHLELVALVVVPNGGAALGRAETLALCVTCQPLRVVRDTASEHAAVLVRCPVMHKGCHLVRGSVLQARAVRLDCIFHRHNIILALELETVGALGLIAHFAVLRFARTLCAHVLAVVAATAVAEIFA